ncbi:uncharacterized protein EKO05_0006202 [Ascochyta rabiei]|uniref:EKC/KEOPS complex subunit GON7 n=1 Tax=Didymella rabiei TaxID=5454 RepID=A0A163AXA0_DIDRA|nr:uncharacterized protein EKO05_0006202 [Ascochyta rabiei]KZM21447.1 hypothetical protein ST47_g7424 [Ascochyta rabiei]UPX15763.1 hypothetical protein EKO05_0006202 [Ascochyta rabiei]
MSTLSADYAAPSGTHAFSAPPPAASASASASAATASASAATATATAERIAVLSALQSDLQSLQSNINAFLTQKMADDKASDANEEENYGEEVVDEE